MFDTARHVPLSAVEWSASRAKAEGSVGKVVTMPGAPWPCLAQVRLGGAACISGADWAPNPRSNGARGERTRDRLGHSRAPSHRPQAPPIRRPRRAVSGDGLRPDAATADPCTSARVPKGLPIRGPMWGLPGSMLACTFMSEMTANGAGAELMPNRRSPVISRPWK